MMRWNPGWFSAPHTYATDRICVVVSGTRYVNSGNDFCPTTQFLSARRICKRTARTPHYDGVLRGQPDPAVIAIFCLGPVDLRFVDPAKLRGAKFDSSASQPDPPLSGREAR
jgi:hypothetical protein